MGMSPTHSPTEKSHRNTKIRNPNQPKQESEKQRPCGEPSAERLKRVKRSNEIKTHYEDVKEEPGTKGGRMKKECLVI